MIGNRRTPKITTFQTNVQCSCVCSTVRHLQTNVTETSDIRVDLNGLDDDTSLRDLASALDAVEGICTSLVTVNNQTTFTVNADGAHLEFDFANNSSGTLAALGLATFFTGDSAGSVSVRRELAVRPETLATSRNDFGENTEDAIQLTGLLDQPLASRGGSTLTSLYDWRAA